MKGRYIGAVVAVVWVCLCGVALTCGRPAFVAGLILFPLAALAGWGVGMTMEKD